MKPDPIDVSDALLAAAQLKVKEAVEAARASATSSSSAHRVAEARCSALEAELQTLKKTRDAQAMEIIYKTSRISHLTLEMKEKDATITEWSEKYAKLEEENRKLEEEARDRAQMDQERMAVLTDTVDALQRLVALQPGVNSGTASNSRSGLANATVATGTRQRRKTRILDSPSDEDEQPYTFRIATRLTRKRRKTSS